MIKYEMLTEKDSWWLCNRETFYIYKRIENNGDIEFFWSPKSIDDIKNEIDNIFYKPINSKEMLEYYGDCYLEVHYKSSTKEERLAGIKILNSQMKKAVLKDDFE